MGNGQLYCRETGTGQVMVLIHGWAMSSCAWRFQEPLASRYHLLMPDLPGHGQSPPQSDLPCFSVNGCAESIARVITERDFSSIVIVGWSLGSMVTLRLASLLPERIAGMILVGGTARFCTDTDSDYLCGLPEKDVRGLSARLKRNYGETLGDFFKLMFAQDELDHDQYQRIVRDVILVGRQPSQEVAHAGLAALATEDLRPLLPTIQTPTLLIHGIADTICPSASARYLADHLPNALLQLLPGIGHAPFLSRPEEFNSLVSQFAAEVSPL